MPFYSYIKHHPDCARISGRLIELKRGLDQQIPVKHPNKNLVLATFNIREFGWNRSSGPRSEEAILYLAEIISRFDIVALQEVNENLADLDKLQNRLGSWWKVVYTDVTEGRKGNHERMAFLYDSRKIRFSGLAGELVLPPLKKYLRGAGGQLQLARTPMIVGFKAGWFKFCLATVHILYGKNDPDYPERIREIQKVAEFLRERTEPQNVHKVFSTNLIVLGDFNIFNNTDVTYEKIKEQGFLIPEEIQPLHTNIGQDKHYDQIAFRTKEGELDVISAGCFKFFDYIYKETDDPETYTDFVEYCTDKGKPVDVSGYRKWRTYQASDHYPLWVELDIDFSEEYLGQVCG